MRLFLSSQGITPNQEALLKLVGKNRKTLFIDNAKDDLPANERAQHVREKLTDYASYGLDPVELDLRNYFDDKNDIASAIKGAGLVWCAGGNTFVLRRALAQSGLDRILVDLLQADKLVFGGSSAGSIIPTPSLHGAENESEDDPSIVPKNYSHEVVWEGLNLVPFHIVPHYESEWFGDEAAAMEKYMLDSSLPYKVLRDGEAIIIADDKVELVR